MSSGREHFAGGNRKRPASNFAQTCNLLSQYIKEKGSLRDVNLEIARNLGTSGKADASLVSTNSTTVDFLTNVGKSVQETVQQSQSTDVLPQYVGVVTPTMFEEDTNKAGCSKSTATNEAKAPQMTIFYGGKVLVFDDFPADKVGDVLQSATKGADKRIKIGVPVASTSETVPNSRSETVPLPNQPPQKPSPSPPLQLQPQPGPESNSSDLPIARRSSLHRFLEKRKDRAVARAPPNQVQRPSTSSPSKSDEQLELKL